MTRRYELQRTSPESQGIESSAILAFIEAAEKQIQDIHSFMLLRHGYVVAEGWWSPYGREIPHMMYSLSKSFTSAAIGLAVAEGRFSVDDTVLSFFPAESPAHVSDFLAGMRVRHLLSMSTGHDTDTLGLIFDESDWVKAFLALPVPYAPGTHFLYNTGATYMLSAIIQKTTGAKLLDYLTPRLLEPLGIDGATWGESPQGVNFGGFGLSVKTEAIARFGQLYLQKGMWQGNQLLPESWVEESTSFQVFNGADAQSDWSQGYGYQFWRCRHGAYRGDGAFGQYCVVLPEHNAVLAITGGLPDMQIPLTLVWDILLPGMQAASQPDNPVAQDKLTEKLSTLKLPTVQGQPTSPVTAQTHRQKYRVSPNGLHIETVAFDFAPSGNNVTLQTATGEQSVPCGYGLWQYGQTTLFADGNSISTVVATNGAWTSDDTFTMVLQLYETPFAHTLVFHFAGNELMIESRVNVGFDPIKTQRLTAHALYIERDI